MAAFSGLLKTWPGAVRINAAKSLGVRREPALEEYMLEHGYIEALLAPAPPHVDPPGVGVTAGHTLGSFQDAASSVHRDEPGEEGDESPDEEGVNEEAYSQLQVPPQPSLPVRMPRRGWCRDSVSSTSCSSGTRRSSASRSLPGTPASLSSESLKMLNEPREFQLSRWEPEPSWGDAPPYEEEQRAASSPQCSGLPSSPYGEAPEEVGNEVVAEKAARTAAERPKVKKSRESVDYGGYCCLREGWQGSTCEAIREDLPQTRFDDDVVALELRSLLRRYVIEPSDALIGDLLHWRETTREAFVIADRARS
mmetsp:Transcript_115547/g.246920  ORF Transcript_115547/g.246920 Transcript_115547/m.246920 type:complete len:309 (+) Transcript_115547:230-1156(+)